MLRLDGVLSSEAEAVNKIRRGDVCLKKMAQEQMEKEQAEARASARQTSLAVKTAIKAGPGAEQGPGRVKKVGDQARIRKTNDVLSAYEAYNPCRRGAENCTLKMRTTKAKQTQRTGMPLWSII